MQLPDDFIRSTRSAMGTQRFGRFIEALSQPESVSLRINPLKTRGISAERVPWCSYGYYLSQRPNFTFDPLLHAGVYYVQEAASMFVHHVVLSLITEPVSMLDLCAAPGGKSTALLGALPVGSTLMSNEPVRLRANILAENIAKWGATGCLVTNNYPHDYRKSGLTFDAILCDVPCSGEGMFRKDPQSIGQWSMKNVEKCSLLQRDIVADAWQCLRPGGLLIYSTCTYNLLEDEQNVLWMLHELGAQPVEVPIDDEWGITASLLPELSAPVYRFIPGFTRGEGLFMAVVRKEGEGKANTAAKGLRQLNVITLPSLQEAADAPVIDLTYPNAIAYLRGEAIVLPPETPRGIVAVGYEGHPLGLAKNIGTRANNLYPKEWRIKSTHLPQEPFLLSSLALEG